MSDELGAKCAVVRIEDGSGDVAVSLRGELDLSDVERVREDLASIIGDRSDRVVLGLSELAFLDSSGIALLVELAHKASQVVLRDPSPLIRRVIDGTGLSNLFVIES